jgi:hypothetical protein
MLVAAEAIWTDAIRDLRDKNIREKSRQLAKQPRELPSRSAVILIR